MSKTITTDWRSVSTGQTTQLDLTDISRYLSARIRWRGVDTPYYVYSTLQNTGSSTSFPSVTDGYEFVSHSASGTITVQNYGSDTYVYMLRLSVGSTVYESQRSVGPGSTATAGISSPDIYSYLPGTVSISTSRVSGSGPLATSNNSVSASTRQRRTEIQVTANPSVIIDGTTTSYSGALTDGQVSSWQTVTGLSKSINAIQHSMGINVRADYQIEYTFEPILPYTVLELPEHASSTTDTTVEYVFELTADTENSATKYHARIRLDNYSTMPNPTVHESKDSQTGWSYWTGSAWAAFPSGGVDPGTKVKYIKVMPLSNIYWDTASWDGYTYGRQGIAYKVRVVLSAAGLYALQINGVAYDALALSVVETSNGEIGGISVTLDNQGGVTFAAINFGDTLTLAISAHGAQEDYEAVVREASPSGNTVTITAITGDGILAERLCKTDYTSQDIGVTVAAIITAYCAPLTAANVDTTTGFIAPVLADGKSPLSVLEELRKNYSMQYYIDKNWDLHFYLPSAVSEESEIKIKLGE